MATNIAQDRLGDLFVREELITADQLVKALAEGKKEGHRLGFALVKMGFVAEEELTRMLSKQYRVPAVDLEKVISIEPKLIKLISSEVALKHLVLPLRKMGGRLTVAMTNPTDMTAIDDLRFITKLNIEPVIVGEYTLRKHLEKYYGTSIGPTRIRFTRARGATRAVGRATRGDRGYMRCFGTPMPCVTLSCRRRAPTRSAKSRSPRACSRYAWTDW